MSISQNIVRLLYRKRLAATITAVRLIGKRVSVLSDEKKSEIYELDSVVEREPEQLPYSTIDEYLNGYEGGIRKRMEMLRELILRCSPDITEKISWGMPTFCLNGNLIHFAAFKNHIGIYPGALENLPTDLTERLAAYKVSKGAIQLPLDKPIDYELIADIARWLVMSVGRQKSGGD